MPKLNVKRTRDLLQDFKFHELFIEELGWSQPSNKKEQSIIADGISFSVKQLAQLSGVAAFEAQLPDEEIPNAKTRAALYKQTSKISHENLLIFVNKARTKSLWYWVKREGTKKFPRDHYYLKGQPGDLFLSKLSSMVVDISELDEKGEVSVLEVARRLKLALDVEATTKKFFDDNEVIENQRGFKTPHFSALIFDSRKCLAFPEQEIPTGFPCSKNVPKYNGRHKYLSK